MVNHVNLIICTPGHSVTSHYVRSFLATAQVLSENNITWGWASEYSSHVADAREMTLNGDNQNDVTETRPFKGKLTYDKILWIDSDISWTPQDVLRLYHSDKDMISGAYLMATGEVIAYKEVLGKSYLIDEVKEMTEPVEIASAGFGFMCMKSGIFESLTRPWFQQVRTSITIDDVEYSFPIMGEDISLCQRAREKGYKVWLDPTVRLVHHKTMKLTWEGPRP